MAYNEERLGARKLFNMAINVVRSNIRDIEDFGDTPVHIVLPLLRHVQRPDQLALIEENSPFLKDHTHELWFNMLTRDVFNWQDMLLTKRKANGALWTEDEVKQKMTHKIYKRSLIKAEEAEKAAEEEMIQKMQAAHQAASSNTPKVVVNDPLLWKKQRTARQDGSSSSLRFTAGSRTRIDTGKSALNKIWREAADSKLKRPGSTLARPAHLLKKGKVIAPRSSGVRTLVTGANAILRKTPQNMASVPSNPRTLQVPSISETSRPKSKPSAPKDDRASAIRSPASAIPKRRAEISVLMPTKRRK